MTILSATKWANNSDLIADCARLGYIKGKVLDPTYGLGNFYNMYRPVELVTGDLFVPAGVKLDFRHLPFRDRTFGTVIYDPPYKFKGTDTDGADARYGVSEYMKWQDRLRLMAAGQIECARVVKEGGFLLTKCMDQVVSGKVRFQSDILTLDRRYHMEKVDELLFLNNPREQPHARQVHSRRNYSTLLVHQRVS